MVDVVARRYARRSSLAPSSYFGANERERREPVWNYNTAYRGSVHSSNYLGQKLYSIYGGFSPAEPQNSSGVSLLIPSLGFVSHRSAGDIAVLSLLLIIESGWSHARFVPGRFQVGRTLPPSVSWCSSIMGIFIAGES